MKFKRILFLLILSQSLNSIFPAENELKLKGYIESPQNLESSPQFSIFFSGAQKTSDADGFFTFNVKMEQLNSICILICSRFEQKFDTNDKKRTNTVAGHYINRKKHYLFFTPARNQENQIVWISRTLPSDEIPQNCVVITMNPKIVESVEDWNINLPPKTARLARVVIKKDVDEIYLNRKSDKSLLGSAIDSQKFHTQEQEVKKDFNIKENLVKVTLPV
jgi:hypothetical protein